MKNILVALDSSPVARKVLEESVLLARAFSAQLTLLRAISLPTELPHELLVAAPDRVEEMLCSQGRGELDALVATIPKELIKATRVQVGTAWQTICESARSENADLIVIGSHGHRIVDRLLGTTAARVVDHADRAVLVVRAATAKS